VSVPGRPFQLSVMFVGKAVVYLSEVPSRCSTLGLAPGLTHKHPTRLERPTRDKHSSLLGKFVNYCFITLDPGVVKAFKMIVIYEG
jgi:hypothetical protein